MEGNEHATVNNKLTQDKGEITTEDLRRLTEAPSAQPLITEAEFSVEGSRSPRPRWTQPLPKFALVGVILFPVFGLVCWFVLGGSNQHQQAENGTQNGSVAQSQVTPTEEMARLQEENAKLKAGMALNDQAEIEQQMRQARTQTQAPRVKTQENPSAQPAPAPARVTPVAQSRSPAYPSPQPFRTQTAPLQRSTPSPAVSRSRSVDPMQQWQQLAQLGSYGSIRPERLATIEFSSGRGKTEASADFTSSVPTARIASTSAVQPSPHRSQTISNQRTVRSEVNHSISQPSLDETPSISESTLELPEQFSNRSSNQSNLPILHDAEAAILENGFTPHSLITGESSAGVLLTPIIVDEAGGSDQFTAMLSEPLTDSRGRIAFPAGTQFLFQVDSLSDTGQVHLSATTATWNVTGYQQELILPTGVIQVRGEAGKPLIAEHYEDRGDEIAGMDAGQFLLGAIGRAAELYTRSDTRVQTRGSSTVITEDNPEPNILAGLLEGGTDAILETIQERNQRAVERMEKMPNARFVKAGTPIEIFVNQSMFMPM